MKSTFERWILLWLLPILIVLIFLFYGPFFSAVLSSLSGPNGWAPTLSHYLILFNDVQVRSAMLCSLGYAVMATLFAMMWGAVFGAAMLCSFPGKRGFSILSKLPLVAPGVIVALMTLTVFEQGGLLSRFLSLFGMTMPHLVRDPLGIGIVITMAWKEAPLMGILIGSALACVPQDLVFAARSLGAGRLKAFFLIRVPLAMSGIIAAALLGFIRSMGAFAIPSLLGSAYPKPITVLMYEAFEYGNVERVYALGTILSCISLAIVWLYFRLADKAERSL